MHLGTETGGWSELDKGKKDMKHPNLLIMQRIQKKGHRLSTHLNIELSG